MSFVNKASNSSILGIVATSFCCAAEDFFLLCIRSLERARSWLLVVLRCWWGEEWAHARIPPVASFDGVMPSSGEWGLLGGTKRYKWVEIKSRKSSTYYYNYVRSCLCLSDFYTILLEKNAQSHFLTFIKDVFFYMIDMYKKCEMLFFIDIILIKVPISYSR